MRMLIYVAVTCFATTVGAPMQKQMQRNGASAGCISKYYNKDLGPLEILMMPLGEKLWLRAWLGMHMSNLLHMEGVDLAEVTQMEEERTKRSISQGSGLEKESKSRENSPESVAPNGYRLWLHLLPEDAKFLGEVQINFTCLYSTNTLTIHASNLLKINEVNIRRLDSANTSDEDVLQNEQESPIQDSIEISKVIRYEKASLHEILLQDTLIKGTLYQITLQYHGPIADKKEGMFLQKYDQNDSSESSWLIGTNLKYENVLKVLPCFYGSKYKASFQVSVAHPIDMESISSTPLLTTEIMSNKSGWQWSHFKITPPMFPNSLAIFVVNPEFFVPVSAITNNGIEVQGLVHGYNVSIMNSSVEYLASGISFLEHHLGVSYPLPQLNILFLPRISDPVEDFWGLMLIGQDISSGALLFYLLKQWFGHLVSAESVNEEYVTRSLAYYYAYFCSLNLENDCEEGSHLMISSHTDFVSLQNIKERINTQDFKDQKMVLFLRMLNFSLTEESFQRGIQVFLKYRSYSAFVEEDLWDALDIQAWSDGTLDRAMSTKEISVAWLSQDALPLININTVGSNNTIVIEQQVFVRHWPYTIRGQDSMLWQIPIPFITENDLKDGRSGILFWASGKRTFLLKNLHDFGSYFIANHNNIGMYIVNYDDSNWRALSESLLFDGMNQHFIIPTKTRASLLRNAWYLAIAGHLDFTLALNMTLFLKYERDISVWKTFTEVYFMVAWKLIATGVEIKFDRFIGDLLVPLYESYEKDSFDKIQNSTEVQALAYYVLCKAGYEPVIEKARLDFDKWLEYHQEINQGVVAGVVRWIDEDWERGLFHVLYLLKEGKHPKIRSFLLSQLAGNPNQEKIERLLSVLLVDSSNIFSKSEIMNVLPAVSSCETFLQFLTFQWEDIKERFASEPNMWQFILEQTAKKCKTPQGITKIEEFYKSHQNDLGTSGNAMKHNIEVARRNMEVVYYQIPDFEEALNKYL